jgi:hypothetical protein
MIEEAKQVNCYEASELQQEKKGGYSREIGYDAGLSGEIGNAWLDDVNVVCVFEPCKHFLIIFAPAKGIFPGPF